MIYFTLYEYNVLLFNYKSRSLQGLITPVSRWPNYKILRDGYNEPINKSKDASFQVVTYWPTESRLGGNLVQPSARHPIDLLRVQRALHVLGTRNVDRAAVTCTTNRHTEIPACTKRRSVCLLWHYILRTQIPISQKNTPGKARNFFAFS